MHKRSFGGGRGGGRGDRRRPQQGHFGQLPSTGVDVRPVEVGNADNCINEYAKGADDGYNVGYSEGLDTGYEKGKKTCNTPFSSRGMGVIHNYDLTKPRKTRYTKS